MASAQLPQSVVFVPQSALEWMLCGMETAGALLLEFLG
jgi:hypothetical protein